MRLDEIIKIKIDSLYIVYNSILKSLNKKQEELEHLDEQISTLNDFIKNYDKKVENLRLIDTLSATKVLVQNGYYVDDDIEGSLRTIKILLNGIYDKSLKTKLSERQVLQLETYISNINECNSKLKNAYEIKFEEYSKLDSDFNKIANEIITLEDFVNKLLDRENEEILTEEELNILLSVISNMQNDIKQLALILFSRYNHDRAEHKEKVFGRVDIEEVKKCFEDAFGHDKASKAINKYKDEVKLSANIGNIKKILDYLKSIDLLQYFENTYYAEYSDLLTICLYGNVDSVKKCYDLLVSNNEDVKQYLKTPSAWINNINKSMKRHSSPRKPKGSKKNEPTLRALAYKVSIEEIQKNKAYLTSKGFNFDYNSSDRRALELPHYKLVENVTLLEQYGVINNENIKEFSVYLLSTPKLDERIDKYVEVSLLNGYEGDTALRDYIKSYPSKIWSISDELACVLYKERQNRNIDSYYDTIRYSSKGQLSSYLTKQYLGEKLSTFEEVESYKRKHFVDTEKEIEDYKKYEDTVYDNFKVEIDDKILEEECIKNLEDNYRVKDNEFVYVFNGISISRLKVLRNYSILKDHGYTDLNALLYSLVSGSYLTYDTLESIKKAIGFTLGGRNELSKRV